VIGETVKHQDEKTGERSQRAGRARDEKARLVANEDELMTLAEAAREFKCSDSWLRKQIRDKRLTAYEKGADRRVYVLRSDLEQLMSPRPRDAD
jgi:excisionase family DNA binding protein